MRRTATVPGVLLALACGCGTKSELNKAEKAVRAALETWQAGGTPQQLAGQAIEIADPDWQAGYRLLGFELKAASAEPQQGPRVVAVLTLEGRGGKEVSKEVAYEVNFAGGNKVAIGRDAFHVGP